ncbi:hypothetical protein EC988_000059 [Linderina pennispora]|nr:hypothetical protein EC988_000059 [Linderina pennispora]
MDASQLPHDPNWEPGSKNYKARVGVMFTAYIVYALYVIVTMVLFHIQSRNPYSELSKRSVKLVTIQAAGCFIIGTLGLVSTAVNRWACFPKLWMFNVGFIIAVSALTARAVQLIVVSHIHILNGQLMNGQDMVNKSLYPRLAARIANKCTAISRFYQVNTERYEKYEALADTRQDNLLSMPRIAENQQVMADIQDRLQRYTSMQHLVTDRALILFIGALTFIIIDITLVINILNTDYSIRPLSLNCPFVWGLVPVFCVIALFVVVICPALLLKVWRLKDAYGIRNDLLVCDTVGVLCIIASLLWELELHKVRQAWSGLFFVWIAAILIHTSSVAIPLYRASRHSKRVENQMYSESKTSSTASSFSALGPRPSIRALGRVRRAEFRQMMDSPHAYSKFREFTATCFSSELTAFVDEYQSLKTATVFALNSQHCQPTTLEQSIGNLTLSDDQSINLGPHEHGAVSAPRHGAKGSPHRVAKAQPLNLNTSATISILETAKAMYSHYDISESTLFPSVVVDKLVTVFSVYINSQSPMALNLPQAMRQRIQERLDNNEMSLTILDEAKDEVLLMLYADVYTRYCSY